MKVIDAGNDQGAVADFAAANPEWGDRANELSRIIGQDLKFDFAATAPYPVEVDGKITTGLVWVNPQTGEAKVLLVAPVSEPKLLVPVNVVEFSKEKAIDDAMTILTRIMGGPIQQI